MTLRGLSSSLDKNACKKVRGRVESVSCLRSEEAVYHRSCMQCFSLKRKRPGTDEVAEDKSKSMKGSPEEEAFLMVIEYLEDNENLYLSIAALQQYMSTLTEAPWTTRWIKRKLIRYYGDSIVESNMEGYNDVIYFANNANNSLYELYNEGRNIDDASEKVRIIKLAANLMKTDIQALNCGKD